MGIKCHFLARSYLDDLKSSPYLDRKYKELVCLPDLHSTVVIGSIIFSLLFLLQNPFVFFPREREREEKEIVVVIKETV